MRIRSETSGATNVEGEGLASDVEERPGRENEFEELCKGVREELDLVDREGERGLSDGEEL